MRREANREKLMGRLEGKSVIITGAGSGIGRAASLLFTKEGAKLIAVDRAEGVKETVAQVREAGGTAQAVMADAGSEKDVMAFIDRAVSAYGRLDAIWANAGVSGGLVPLAEQTVEHWQEVLRINLIGPFLAIKYSMPHMIKQKSGSIVCTASVAGLKAGASGHPYGASKAGVISLVQTTAYSLSVTGVRINAVCPGLIETGMTKPVFDRSKERPMTGSATKQSRVPPATLDCFAALAMTADMPSHSRGAFRPSFANSLALFETEGAGKAGCRLHPRSRVPKRT